ncbi:MAG: hypothetical protein ABW321_36190 [Polyangiales bacterium]
MSTFAVWIERSGRTSGALVALALAQCTVTVPDGKFVCDADRDCPVPLRCDVQRQLCFHSLPGFDAAVPDASPGLSRQDTGAEPPPPPPIDEPDAAPREDAAPPVTPPGEDGGPVIDPPDATVPPEDAEVIDPNCTPDPAPEDLGIFVSPPPVGSMQDNCGSAREPCGTIALGIERAQETNRELVFLDAREYSETVQLAAGITLQGGWDNISGTWTRHCGSTPETKTVLHATSEAAVWAEYEGRAVLDTLSIESLPTADVGQTLYGVFARGASTELALHRVRIHAAPGGTGAPGAVGVTAPAPTEGCAAGSGEAASGVGAPGGHAAVGSFAATGYVPGLGAVGEQGPSGQNAVLAEVTCRPCVTSGSCARGADGVCGGTLSGGESCPTAGAPGCGGPGGSGGSGGGGGGSSIALFAWEARVTLEASVLTSSAGGGGGLGGEGAVGAAGGLGGAGAPGIDCSICLAGLRGPIITPIPTPIPVEPAFSAQAAAAGPSTPRIEAEPFPLPNEPITPWKPILSCIEAQRAAAVSGRSGGAGAAGGRGGDGSGGHSYAIYRGAGATVEVKASDLTHGEAGTSANGAAGLAATIGADTP